MQGRKKRMMAMTFATLLAFAVLSGCGSREDELTLEEVRTQEENQSDDNQSDGSASEEQEKSGSGEEASAFREEQEEGEPLCVFVCGQVAEPGVYELPAGSRIYQAVEEAGGMLETADETYVNQAQYLEDGQRIYIPSVEEAASGLTEAYEGDISGQTDGAEADGRVNINTAGKEELMTLTGIGEKKAEAIIQYREASGGFQTIEELMQVEGIKEGTFEKIKEDIKV